MRMEDLIKEKLTKEFEPEELIVENQSARHHGHAGDDGSGQTHFDVKIVSKSFEGKSRLERQRSVMKCTESLFDEGLHAFSVKTLTPEENKNI